MNEAKLQSGPIVLEPRWGGPYPTKLIDKLLSGEKIWYSDIHRIETERPIFLEVPRTKDRFDDPERCALMDLGSLHYHAYKFAVVAQWHRWRGRTKIAAVWQRRAENALTAAKTKETKK